MFDKKVHNIKIVRICFGSSRVQQKSIYPCISACEEKNYLQVPVNNTLFLFTIHVLQQFIFNKMKKIGIILNSDAT